MKNKKPQQPQGRPHSFAIGLSIAAIIISCLGWWEAHQARKLSYVASLPALSTQVDLVEELAAGQDIHFRVTVENHGKTPARRFHPTLRFRFASAAIPFVPSYDGAPDASQQEAVSELAPDNHTILISTMRLKLAHDHDVNAVFSGQDNLYVFGKVTYEDVLDGTHELHFCRFYRPSPGTEPLKLNYCNSYNESF
jgi:hypothetical protein